VSLVDDDNLVCQVDFQSFSGITMKEEVVRQGDYLEDFNFVTWALRVKGMGGLLLEK
jgi:hypothetical protein